MKIFTVHNKDKVFTFMKSKYTQCIRSIEGVDVWGEIFIHYFCDKNISQNIKNNKYDYIFNLYNQVIHIKNRDNRSIEFLKLLKNFEQKE